MCASVGLAGLGGRDKCSSRVPHVDKGDSAGGYGRDSLPQGSAPRLRWNSACRPPDRAEGKDGALRAGSLSGVTIRAQASPDRFCFCSSRIRRRFLLRMAIHRLPTIPIREIPTVPEVEARITRSTPAFWAASRSLRVQSTCNRVMRSASEGLRDTIPAR